MTGFIAKRLLSGLLVIAGLLVLTFFLVRLSPGNPSAMAWDPSRSIESMQRLESTWGLDQPIWGQFKGWLSSLLHGDFGVSYTTHRPVNMVLAETIPNTLYLTIPALIFQLVFGSLLGILQIIKVDTWFDRLSSFITLLFFAIPSFWLAIMLVMLFSQAMQWLPSSQMVSYTFHEMGLWQQFIDRVSHLVLPVLTLGLASLGITSRYVRNGLAGIMEQPFIMSARARGFDEKRVVFRHAFKNILVPVVTVTGQHLPAIISGSVVIELIFSWPGMGRLMVLSAFGRDYPVIIACTFFMSLFVVIGTLLVDILCAIIDPRIRVAA